MPRCAFLRADLMGYFRRWPAESKDSAPLAIDPLQNPAFDTTIATGNQGLGKSSGTAFQRKIRMGPKARQP